MVIFSLLSPLYDLFSPLSSLSTRWQKACRTCAREGKRGPFSYAREREGGMEEVERLQVCASPHDGSFIYRERRRGEREKEKEKEKKN